MVGPVNLGRCVNAGAPCGGRGGGGWDPAATRGGRGLGHCGWWWVPLLLLALGSFLRGESREGEEVVELSPYEVSEGRWGERWGEVTRQVQEVGAEALAREGAAGLGEALSWEPGVAGGFHGQGASRPIVRGLGGSRVSVVQGGLSLGEVSDLSPDHAVVLDPALLDRVRIWRGPGVVAFGEGASAGVVDGDMGLVQADGEPFRGGKVEVRQDSVNRGLMAVFDHGEVSDRWRVRVKGVRREADDYRIPGPARRLGSTTWHLHGPEDEAGDAVGSVPNTHLRTLAGGVGLTWVGPQAAVGGGLSGFRSVYGVPFHLHTHSAPGAAPAVESPEAPVWISLNHLRLETDAVLKLPAEDLAGLRWRTSFSTYRHAEMEGSRLGSEYRKQAFDVRGEMAWEGNGGRLVGVQLTGSDFSTAGPEANAPRSLSGALAAYAMEQWDFEGATADLGLRVGWRGIRLPRHRALGKPLQPTAAGTLGGEWHPWTNWSLGARISASRRQPDAAELFSDGPHAASFAFVLGNPDLQPERVLAGELTLRTEQASWHGSLTVFQQRFERFIFPEITGWEYRGLPIYAFAQRNSSFKGGEAILGGNVGLGGEGYAWWRVTWDYVQAEDLVHRIPLPRVPPMRFTASFGLRKGPWSWELGLRHAWAQTRFQPVRESASPSYTVVSADLGYRWLNRLGLLELHLHLGNLTNAEIRPHTSLLRDLAPLPGRNLALSLRLSY